MEGEVMEEGKKKKRIKKRMNNENDLWRNLINEEDFLLWNLYYVVLE